MGDALSPLKTPAVTGVSVVDLPSPPPLGFLTLLF